MCQDKNKNLYKKKWRDIARREFIGKKKKKKNILFTSGNLRPEYDSRIKLNIWGVFAILLTRFRAFDGIQSFICCSKKTCISSWK